MTDIVLMLTFIVGICWGFILTEFLYWLYGGRDTNKKIDKMEFKFVGTIPKEVFVKGKKVTIQVPIYEIGD